jgi:hypothetical protein
MKLGPRPLTSTWKSAEDAQLLALLDSKMDRASIARKLKRTLSTISMRTTILNWRRHAELTWGFSGRSQSHQTVREIPL